MSLPPSPPSFNAATFFVDRHLDEGRGGRRAFRHGGGWLTYADVAARANRLGGVLAGLGVARGQRVVLALDDTPEFVAAFWGAVKLGAVAVPLNTLLAGEQYAFVLDDSRAPVAVVEPAVAARLAATRDRWPWLRHVLVRGPDLDARTAATADALAPAATVAADVMYWGYTSGSTGPPKAAVHTHGDFVAAAELVGVGVFGIGADDLVFSASKMSFAFGLGNTLYFPARVGAAALLMPGPPEPRAILDAIVTERPTVFFAVPTVYARLLQIEGAQPDELASLRLCVSSGEALPPALFDAWQKRSGLELVDVVGSTEALHDFIANRPGQTRRGSAGRLVPGFEARLVDGEGRPVLAGAVGHLLVKGPTTAREYWNRPERTRATMVGEWLRTGDMFWQDADGWFYFAGRSDDMLKVAGQWVSPAEVEAILVEHPAVAEAAVVGREDGAGLARPQAFVVLTPGLTAAPALVDDVLAFARKRLAGFKVPRSVEVVAELPKTATGKVQRFRLRGASPTA